MDTKRLQGPRAIGLVICLITSVQRFGTRPNQIKIVPNSVKKPLRAPARPLTAVWTEVMHLLRAHHGAGYHHGSGAQRNFRRQSHYFIPSQTSRRQIHQGPPSHLRQMPRVRHGDGTSPWPQGAIGLVICLITSGQRFGNRPNQMNIVPNL